MAQKEKLEEARRLYKDANADQRYVLERLSPELVEEEPQVYETENGEVITYSESKGYEVVEPRLKINDRV